MRSKEEDTKTAARKLEKDIRNSVHHIFNDHTNCSEFCTKKTPTATDTVHLTEKVLATGNCDDDDDDDNDGDDVMENLLNQQERFWVEGTSEKDMQESRSSQQIGGHIGGRHVGRHQYIIGQDSVKK